MAADRRSDRVTKTAVAPYLRLPIANTPAWLSDNRLAYLDNRTGVPQLWQTDLRGGPPAALTSFEDRISALLSAPDGRRLVFGMDASGDERDQLWTLIPDEAATPLTTDRAVMNRLGAFSPDGRRLAYASNARGEIPFDVWTMGLDDPASARMILATDETLRPIAWSPDGQTLLVHRSRTMLDNDLYLVSAAGGEPELLTPHAGEAAITAAEFAPAGGAVYLLTNQDREFIALARLDLVTRRLDFLVTPEWDVEALALSPDGRWLAYAVNEAGISTVTLLETASGDERTVSALPVGVVSGLTWSPASDLLAFALSGPRHPSTIWLCGLDALARQVSGVGLDGLDRDAFVVPEAITYPTFDGRQIPAFWYRPAGDGPWPAVVDVHGGPEGQRRVEFSPVVQFLLARGFAVLSTNVRGSTGYGKTFCHLDDVELRMDSVADLDAANAWLRTQPGVAPEKLVVFGGSYGGFMVLSSLTTYPDHWAAGVDIVGIANFVTFFEQTGPWRRHLRSPEYGDPERDHDLLVSLSPIHQAEAITAPLLVIHGRNDPRVPLVEAEQIVSRLQALGRDVTLLVFDDEGHGLVKLANKIVGYGAMADFLDRVLAPN
ncbi:MAG: S9 family peptidase [Chloroflexota bacterium]|nr:S9 family peptidase [Chloroflexota bacterium]